jgi:predicted nucleic acid-binding protein
MPYSKTIYWDASIWIAWLCDEQRPNQEMAGVEECVLQVDRGEILLITSAVMYTEVNHLGLPQDAADKLGGLTTKRNVSILPLDPRVGALSIELRKFYRDLSRRDGKPELTEHDADHLATAIHYRADAFYTFDDGKKGGRGLLSLDGNVAGHRLVVCKPPITQYKLFQ